MSPTIVFIAPAECRQICLYVCVCVALHACPCVCARMCGHSPDPKNAVIVHHIFGVCRETGWETEAEGECRVHLLLSSRGWLRQKIRRVGVQITLGERRECCICFLLCVRRMCTVTVCVREGNDCFSLA